MAGFAESIKKLYVEVSLVPLSFLGIGFQRAWTAMLSSSCNIEGISETASLVGFFVATLVALLLTLFSKKIGSLVDNAPLTYVYVVGALSGTLLVIASNYTQIDILYIAGMGLSYGSSIVCLLMWAELYCLLSPWKTAFYYSLAILFGEIIRFAFYGQSMDVIIPFLLAFPLLGVVWVKSSVAKARTLESYPKNPSKSYMPALVLIIVFMALVSFAKGLTQFSVTSVGEPFIFLASIVPCCLCALVLYKNKIERITSVLSWVYLGFIILVPFAYFVRAYSPVLFDTVIKTNEITITILTVVILSGVCREFGLNPLLVNGVERTVRYGGQLFGMMLSGSAISLLGIDVPDEAVSILLLVILAIFAGLALPYRKFVMGFYGGFNKENKPPGEAGYGVSETALRSTLETISVCSGLTARQKEIFFLLAYGKKSKEIEEELCIAKGTLKAHTSNIYQKLGIQSKDELSQVVESELQKLSAAEKN